MAIDECMKTIENLVLRTPCNRYMRLIRFLGWEFVKLGILHLHVNMFMNTRYK